MRNGLLHFVSLLILLGSAAVPAAHAASPAPVVNGGNYVEIGSVFTRDAQYEAWSTARIGLRQDFDDICGDTFCEGEYSNIESLRVQCSAHRVTGRIGSCIWSFGASDESIDARSGRIATQGKVWQCVMPLSAGTTVDQLLAALSVEHPLYATLPASSKTVYDGLIDCL